ncbi:MAG: peroxidase family protein [Luteolibacter sp.]
MKKPLAAFISLAITIPLLSAEDDRPPHPHFPDIPIPRSRKIDSDLDQEANELRTESEDSNQTTIGDRAFEFRAIDGYSNNPLDPTLGTPGRPFARFFDADYSDGIESPAGEDRPSAREISNTVAAQEESIPNSRGASDFLWQWGQFLDHDIDQTSTIDPAEEFNITVPSGDIYFDPSSTGTGEIPLNRSFYEYDEDGVRQQVNEITSFIDGSQIYGSDETRANALRKLDGSGELKVTTSEFGDLLPYNESGEENVPATSNFWFLAGDIRANEQAALTAMHTLFVREHNHWARTFREDHGDATDETIYQFARSIVGAELQHITYSQFLPIILGPKAIPPYRGYREQVDPRIANSFATAAFRFGHTLLPETILRIDAEGETAAAGDLALADAFFDPSIVEEDGIDNILRGLSAQLCEELDGQITDSLRNFLFGEPGSGGLDLASLNIQRGRDHGLPAYNEVRKQLGIRPARRIRDVNPDRDVFEKLEEAYEEVDDIDLWVGGLNEPHVAHAMVGPVFHRILTRQFRNLRDGDRFWFESTLPPELVDLVKEQTLAAIIRRNTNIGEELQENVFIVPGDEEE